MPFVDLCFCFGEALTWYTCHCLSLVVAAGQKHLPSHRQEKRLHHDTFVGIINMDGVFHDEMSLPSVELFEERRTSALNVREVAKCCIFSMICVSSQSKSRPVKLTWTPH